ncbi:hypothetical protein [Cardinium endosymbiont of Nabis limbatus]|uniref:hypothetical protein n=1 Tax=Cardinium endosymbiont of Nabis limbatus TaxID=3066217 RepID=UPI003AF360C1
MHAVVTATRAAARVVAARVVVNVAVPTLHSCAKGVVGAATAIGGFANRVASAAAEVARATDR